MSKKRAGKKSPEPQAAASIIAEKRKKKLEYYREYSKRRYEHRHKMDKMGTKNQKWADRDEFPGFF